MDDSGTTSLSGCAKLTLGTITTMESHQVNRLYYGDNLTVLRSVIDDESVDLIYLDPPFNSQATYNVLFQEHGGRAIPRPDRGL